MLYTTTRSDLDSFTPERALKEPCAPDGGLYIPMKLHRMDQQELAALMGQSTPGIVAAVMNYFFNTKLSARDIQFTLGNELAKLVDMSHRITVAECWRNPDGDFSRVQRLLAQRLAVDKRSTPVGEWLKVAVRIALMMALYAQLVREGKLHLGQSVDVALLGENFCGPAAAWYAREMGLPIGTIVCCCNENGAAWDLLRQGDMKTDMPVRRTKTPRCDISRPEGLERLIRAACGLNQAQNYAFTCAEGGRFELSAERLKQLNKGMYASVTSDIRLPRVMANVFTTNGYVLCPYSALVYSGLMDCRAATGRNGHALMICENSPLQCEDAVVSALGIGVSELHEKLDVVV